MQIKVVAVDQPQSVTKGTRSWHTMDVSYKNLETNKIQGKTLVSFAYPKVWDYFKSVDMGTQVEVTTTKVGDFWQWTDFSPMSAEAPPEKETPRGDPAPTSRSAAPTPYKNTYETPEERAWKQVLIVRQSSASTAVTALTTNAKVAPNVEDVLVFAAQLEQWVNRKPDPMEAVAAMPDDVPQ